MKSKKASPKRKNPAITVLSDPTRTGYYYADRVGGRVNLVSEQKARTIVGDRALQAGRGAAMADLQTKNRKYSVQNVTPKTRAKPKQSRK